MRERRVVDAERVIAARITPARAGKTGMPPGMPLYRRDHPRSCGKDTIFNYNHGDTAGSPPLVRERRDDSKEIGIEVRITPARAGKTIRISYMKMRAWDHPRSCGKDSNGFLYFRPFTLTDIQNLFNFFAKHLTSSASPNARWGTFLWIP